MKIMYIALLMGMAPLNAASKYTKLVPVEMTKLSSDGKGKVECFFSYTSQYLVGKILRFDEKSVDYFDMEKEAHSNHLVQDCWATYDSSKCCKRTPGGSNNCRTCTCIYHPLKTVSVTEQRLKTQHAEQSIVAKAQVLNKKDNLVAWVDQPGSCLCLTSEGAGYRINLGRYMPHGAKTDK